MLQSYRTLSALCLALVVSASAGLQAQQQEWARFGRLHEGRNFFGAVPIGDGRILVAGGYGDGGFGPDGVPISGSVPTASSEVIDAKSGRITRAGAMNVPHAEAVFLLAPDSSVVAISGVSADGWRLTKSVELYNRRTRSWRTIGELKVPRRQHAACFISDDEFLVIGGRHEDLSSMATAEIFNIRTGTSRQIADYPHRVNTPVTARTPDGRILALSGREGGTNSFRSPNVYEYDRSLNRWNQISTLSTAINAPQLMTLWNGDVIVTGGAMQDAPFQLSADVLRWSGTGFTAAAGMTVGRFWHGQAQIAENRIIITGGWTERQEAIRECDFIDLATGRSTAGPGMIEARRFFQTVSVPVRMRGRTYIRVLAISGQNAQFDNRRSVEVLMEYEDAGSLPTITRAGDELVASTALNYQWNFNGEPIPGATAGTWRVTSAGDYTVSTVLENDTITSLPFEVGTLGVEDAVITGNVVVAPNPTADHLSLRLDLERPVRVTLELAGMRGEILIRLDDGVQSGSYSRELSLRELPPGVYLLRMQVGEESRMMKVVRQ